MNLAYHIVTLFLFTKSDFKSTLIPLVSYLFIGFYSLWFFPVDILSDSSACLLFLTNSSGDYMDMVTLATIRYIQPDAPAWGGQTEQAVETPSIRPYHA